jgi:hypothetical protein
MMTREARVAALELLLAQEALYLVASGWERATPGTFKGTPLWSRPGEARHQNITQGHAVNAQKQYDRRAGLYADSREAQKAFGGG